MQAYYRGWTSRREFVAAERSSAVAAAPQPEAQVEQAESREHDTAPSVSALERARQRRRRKSICVLNAETTPNPPWNAMELPKETLPTHDIVS